MSQALIINANGQDAPPEPPPVKHPFPVHLMVRVLTRKNGPGVPDLTPRGVSGVMDVAAWEPTEVVALTNEYGDTEVNRVDYARGVLTPSEFFDNTRPDRLFAIMRPDGEGREHELGVVNRVAHKIAAMQALEQALGQPRAALPQDFTEQLRAEEERVAAVLAALDALHTAIDEHFTPTEDEE